VEQKLETIYQVIREKYITFEKFYEELDPERRNYFLFKDFVALLEQMLITFENQ
jgi:hypothetical protein